MAGSLERLKKGMPRQSRSCMMRFAGSSIFLCGLSPKAGRPYSPTPRLFSRGIRWMESPGGDARPSRAQAQSPSELCCLIACLAVHLQRRLRMRCLENCPRMNKPVKDNKSFPGFSGLTHACIVSGENYVHGVFAVFGVMHDHAGACNARKAPYMHRHRYEKRFATLSARRMSFSPSLKNAL